MSLSSALKLRGPQETTRPRRDGPLDTRKLLPRCPRKRPLAGPPARPLPVAAAPCPAATGRSLARGIPPTLLPLILEAANATARPRPRSGAPHRASAWLPARPSPGEKWLRLSPSEGARPGRKVGACGTRSTRGAVRDLLVLKGKTHTCKHKPALLRHRSPVSKFHGEPSVSFAIMQQKEAYAPQRRWTSA